MTTLDFKIPPAAVWVAFVGAIMACAGLFPDARFAFPGQRMVAGGLVLVGVLIAIAGVREFRRAKTTVSPLATARARSVVATGIYQRTRNPMYLGMALALTGVAIWTASLPGLGLVPLFCVYLTAFQIKPEERMLLAHFGPAYATYLARVRRWL